MSDYGYLLTCAYYPHGTSCAAQTTNRHQVSPRQQNASSEYWNSTSTLSTISHLSFHANICDITSSINRQPEAPMMSCITCANHTVLPPTRQRQTPNRVFHQRPRKQSCHSIFDFFCQSIGDYVSRLLNLRLIQLCRLAGGAGGSALGVVPGLFRGIGVRVLAAPYWSTYWEGLCTASGPYGLPDE